MGFFKKLFGGASFRSTFEADPKVADVVGAMKRSNIAPALKLYNASAKDPELRYRLVKAASVLFGEASTRAALLDAWAENTPDDPFAVYVRAAWEIASAPSWRPDDPEEVKKQAHEAHSTVAMEALSHYERFAAKAPEDPLPWTLMLELPTLFELDGKRRQYGEVTRRLPGFFPAQLAMHHFLTAMWYGDHDESVDFMREAAAKAPEGSELHALVPYAHVRVWSYEKFYGDGEDAAAEILTNPEIQEECVESFVRSLWSPKHVEGHWTPWARHVAALWFHRVGDKARAKTELEKVGDVFDEDKDPWYLPSDAYAEIRQEYGL